MSTTQTAKPTAPLALAADLLPAAPAKHRITEPDDMPPPPAVHEVSRSTPRPQLTSTPHKTVRMAPHRMPTRYYRPPAQSHNRIPVGNIQAYARALVGSDYQFTCLAHIIDRESGWNPHAANPEGAYGIPQALPGAKMSSAGSDWRDNPQTQIRWMLSYIASRYGTPCNAWGFWQGHSWY